MKKRTQLNINVESDLIKKIKTNAIEEEMNLGEFVNDIIKCFLTAKELKNESSLNIDRLDKIECELFNISNQLDKILSNKMLVHYLLENKRNEYFKLLSKQFIILSKNRMISRKELWKEFSNHAYLIKIKKIHLSIFQDILRGEDITTSSDFISIIKEYKKCPITGILFKMTNGNLLPRLLELYYDFNALALV